MGGNTDVWVQQICPEVRIYEDDGHLQKQAVPTLLFFFTVRISLARHIGRHT